LDQSRRRAFFLGAVLAIVPSAAPAAEVNGMFELTENHLRLLRQATVLWSPVESGAPAILVSPLEMDDEAAERLDADFAARAGLSIGTPPSAAERERVKQLIADLPEALAQLLAHGELRPGRFEYSNPLVQFPFAADTLPPEIARLASAETVDFSVTEEHLALLRAARWQGLWMNAKRPYGDMTYFELDMAKLLHQPDTRTAEGGLPEALERRLGQLHAETLPALQVFLKKAVIAAGEYPRLPVEPGPGSGLGSD